MKRRSPVAVLLLLLALGCTLLRPTPLLIGTPQPAPSSEGPADLTGVYQVTGRNLDGTPYQGTLTVEAYGEVYTLVWELGNTRIEGVGLLEGNMLSAGWDCGVATYSILENGEMEGVWTICGENRTGTERATPWRRGIQGGQSPHSHQISLLYFMPDSNHMRRSHARLRVQG